MRFEVTYPSGVKNDVELEGSSALLGRDPGCDLVLNDVKCSRRHAVIEAGPEGMIIRDNGSANGIYVNGKKVDSAKLLEGDQIRLGQIVVTVLGEDFAPTVAMDAAEVANLEETGPLARPGEIDDDVTQERPPAGGGDVPAVSAPAPEPPAATTGPTQPRRTPTPPPREPELDSWAETPALPRESLVPKPPPVRPAPPPAVATKQPSVPRTAPPPPTPSPPPASPPSRPAVSRAPDRHTPPVRGGMIERPVTISLLAASWMLGVLIYGGGGIAFAALGRLPEPWSVLLALGGVCLAAISAALGYGLWTLSPWARVLQLVMAGLGILTCVGTLPGLATLVYMLRPEVPVLFSGAQDKRQLAPRQAEILDAAKPDTLFAAAILVGMVIGAVMAAAAAWGAYWYFDAAGPGGPFSPTS